MKLAVLSGKGGVGKTLLSINLSVIFAQEGYKVLLVDANFSAPTVATYFKTVPNTHTIDEALAKGATDLSSLVWIHPSGVHFVTPSFNLVGLDDETLRNIFTLLSPLFPNYDFVIFDGPAGVEKDAYYTVLHSDAALIVTNPNYPALYNALKVNYFVQAMKKPVVGAVLNMVTGKDEVSREEAQAIVEAPIIGEIPYDPEVKKAVNAGQPVVLYNPNAPASRAIYQIAEALLGRKLRRKPRGGGIGDIIKRVIDWLLG
ncbi:MAG: P-loop NTPase [Candidatus Diapherotrites archaeon]|nr:P-loop NTPase [Candidatus Diapherotrites archaeon]